MCCMDVALQIAESRLVKSERKRARTRKYTRLIWNYLCVGKTRSLVYNSNIVVLTQPQQEMWLRALVLLYLCDCIGTISSTSLAKAYRFSFSLQDELVER